MENSINKRIKTLRISLNLSQTEFANKIGTTLTTISRIENGGSTPQISTTKKIIEIFNIDSEWLLNGNGSMYSEDLSKIDKSKNNWKEEAYLQLKEYNESLKQEVLFLKSIVSGLLPAQKSFNSGTDVAGFLPKKLISSVRVQA